MVMDKDFGLAVVSGASFTVGGLKKKAAF